MKIDVVVPSCGTDLANMMMTLASCEKDLKDSGFDYKYIIVGNGNIAPEHRRAFNLSVEWARSTGRLAEVFDLAHAIQPMGARNLGAGAGTGEVICFFDDHCRVHEGFFTNIIKTFESTDAASVRGCTYLDGFELSDTGRFHQSKSVPQSRWFHHILDFESAFWVKTASQLRCTSVPTFVVQRLNPDFDAESPYRVASSGHGAFACGALFGRMSGAIGTASIHLTARKPIST